MFDIIFIRTDRVCPVASRVFLVDTFVTYWETINSFMELLSDEYYDSLIESGHELYISEH